jgi:hypothetical protein
MIIESSNEKTLFEKPLQEGYGNVTVFFGEIAGIAPDPKLIFGCALEAVASVRSKPLMTGRKKPNLIRLLFYTNGHNIIWADCWSVQRITYWTITSHQYLRSIKEHSFCCKVEASTLVFFQNLKSNNPDVGSPLHSPFSNDSA